MNRRDTLDGRRDTTPTGRLSTRFSFKHRDSVLNAFDAF